MPRGPRVVVPGVPHHITQRGNRGEDVFFSDDGRYRYLSLLAQYSHMHSLDILAYCLMTNHVHLVAIPRTKDSIGNALRPLHTRYTQHVNWKEGLEGVLWRDRPYSCPLDDAHFWAAVRYVERNPVRAGLVGRAELYPWSSAAAHCDLHPDPIISGAMPPHPDFHSWSAWLSDPDDERMIAAIRRGTRGGYAVGDDAFFARLDCAPRPSPRGRPRKNK